MLILLKSAERIIAVVGYGRHQLSTAASTSAGRLFLNEVAEQCIRFDLRERPSFSLLLAPRKSLTVSFFVFIEGFCKSY